MRIGVDATCWQNRRGYGRHARALLHALATLNGGHRYTLFLDSADGIETLPPHCESCVAPADVPASVAASARGSRSPRDMWRVSRAMSAGNFDVLLFPTIYTYVPVLSQAKKVVVMHDVIAETYPGLTVPGLQARLFWTAKTLAGRLQADALVTVSAYSRDRIVERFPVARDRVFVVGEANDPIFRVLPGVELTPRLRGLGIDPERPLVIYIGGFSPHKNLEALIAAFAAVPDPTQLVMVGEYKNEVFHSYFGAVAAEVKRRRLEKRVIFTGYLPDEDVAVLLNHAAVLALPSLMEGFGLPAVEAAACGCPVIATENSPLPELLGAGGLYIKPTADALERALVTVLGSAPLRRRMSSAGVTAARRLTWDTAARQMMAVFDRVVAA